MKNLLADLNSFIKKINFHEGFKRIFTIVKIIWLIIFAIIVYIEFQFFHFYNKITNPTLVEVSTAEHHFILLIIFLSFFLLPIILYNIKNFKDFFERAFLVFYFSLFIIIRETSVKLIVGFYIFSAVLFFYVVFNYMLKGFFKKKKSDNKT